jgi:hypothetical protein
LEQLYLSATVKEKNVRKVNLIVFRISHEKFVDANAEIQEEERLLTIHVQRGWKNGTKLTYPKEGDQEIGASLGET